MVRKTATVVTMRACGRKTVKNSSRDDTPQKFTPAAGLVLPVLGALPDALIIAVSGLGGSHEEVAEQVQRWPDSCLCTQRPSFSSCMSKCRGRYRGRSVSTTWRQHHRHACGAPAA